MNGILESPKLRSALSANQLTGIKKRYALNPEKFKIATYKWRESNRDKAAETQRKYRQTHLKEQREACSVWAKIHRDEINAAVRERRLKNPDKYRAKDRKNSAKRRNTIQGKLNINVGNRIRDSLNKSKNKRRWGVLVDFTLMQLKKHLEKQFKEGMTWENYGSYWHIDHKIPIAVFNYTKPEDIDFKKCWSLSNLQPLEAKENIKKSAKLNKPFQPSLCINI